jgi:nitrate reductase cytochrome c-type subunit
VARGTPRARRLAALALVVLPAFVACVKAAPDFYATRPPFERPREPVTVPRGLQGLSARECGGCHVEIYREWQQSVHAQAWSEPQFQAELHKQPGVRWLCVNCHTPLRNQIDSLVVALADDDVERPTRRANPAFDAALQSEGITCAACHVRDGAVEGPFGDGSAPHAVRKNPEFRSPDMCLRCHQAVQAYPGKNFVCTFQTGDEWREGSHAAAGRICQDCHMPPVDRPLVAGGPMRRTGRHGWIGSHLAKGGETLPALWDSLAALLPPGIALAADAAPRTGAGEAAAWSVRAINAHAGHRLPTGDPERGVIVTLEAVTDAGDTIGRTEHLIAQRYQWSPEVKKLSDNRLAAGDSVTLTLRYRVPPGPYRLVARAVNERMSDANADYHRLGPGYPRRAEVARVEHRVRPAR